MRHIFHLSLFCFLGINTAIAQPFERIWGQNSGESEFIRHIAATPDEQLIAIGTKTINAIPKVWVGLSNLQGNLTSDFFLENIAPELAAYGFSGKLMPNGDIFISGAETKGIGPSEDDFVGMAMQVTQQGELVWHQTYLGTTMLMDALVLDDGFVVVGCDGNYNADNAIAIRLDAQGDTVWQIKTHLYSSSIYHKIFMAQDGNLILIGRANTVGVGFQGAFVQKISPEGVLIWQTLLDLGWNENLSWVDPNKFILPTSIASIEHPNGEFWLAHRFGNHFALVRLSQEGAIVDRLVQYSNLQRKTPQDMALRPDGSVVLVGDISSTASNTAPHLGWSVQLTASGSFEHEQVYAPPAGITDNILTTLIIHPNGGFYAAGHRKGAEYDALLYRAEDDGNILPYKLQGRVIIDLNGNCIADSNEPPAEGWWVDIGLGQAVNRITDAAGNYQTTMPETNSTITLVRPEWASAWSVCGLDSATVSIGPATPLVMVDFVVSPPDPNCAQVSLQMTQPDLIRCQSSDFIVAAHNTGTAASMPQKIEVTLPEELELMSASLAFEDLGGQKFAFEIGSIPALDQVQITLNVRLDCATQLGATHPIRTTIGPLECAPAWQGPDFEVTGTCNGDHIQFFMRNVGGGGPMASTRFRILSDYLLQTDWTTVVLPENGPDVALELPADGRTWRIELEQPADMPRANQPSWVVEGCGKGNNNLHSTGFAGYFSPDEARPDIAMVVPVNTMGIPNRIVPLYAGIGVNQFVEQGYTGIYTAHARLDNMATDKVVFTLEANDNFEMRTFTVLAASGKSTLYPNNSGTIRIELTDLPTNASKEVSVLFSIKTKPITEFGPAKGKLTLYGTVYAAGSGTKELRPLFQQISNWTAKAQDTFNNYPTEILQYGGPKHEYSRFAFSLPDGSAILGGLTQSYAGTGTSKSFLIRTDAQGRAYWLNTYTTTGDTYFSAIGGRALENNNLLLVGSSLEIDGYWATVLSIAPDGTKLWHRLSRPDGANSTAYVTAVNETTDGGLIVVGQTRKVGEPTWPFSIKLDKWGNETWVIVNKFFTAYTAPYDVVQTTDKNYITAVGDYFDNLIEFSKTDSVGNLIWELAYTGTNDVSIEYITDIAPTPDGGCLAMCVGLWYEGTENIYGIVFLKLSENGDLEWSKKSRMGPDYTFGNPAALLPDPNGGYWIAGDVRQPNFFNNDIVLIHVDTVAEYEWIRTFETNNSEQASAIIRTSDNQLLLWGHNNRYESSPTYENQAVLVRTDTLGNLYVNTKSPTASIPTVQVFPNPASERALLRLIGQPPLPLPWVLYDMLGKPVRRGSTNDALFEVPVSQLPNGLYHLAFPGSVGVAKILVQH